MAAFPKIKLTYFNATARAEAARLAFFIGDVPFVDNRVTSEQFGALKSTLPYGQLPVLEIDGEVLAQSQAVLRYAGRLANLYPVNDALAALKVDEIVAGMDDLLDEMVPSLREQDPAKKKALRETFANETTPHYFKKVETRLLALKDHAAFQSEDDIFIHDLAIFAYLLWVQSGVIDHLPTIIADGFPAIRAAETKVARHPKVKQWFANSRKLVPQLKLTYFNLTIRAEQIRLALHIAGVPFEDERLSDKEFGEVKAKFPFELLPVLTVNGEMHSQSQQILRYVGILTGLYPSNDAVEAMRIDEVLSAVDDIFTLIRGTYTLSEEEKPTARKALGEEGGDVYKLLAALDKRAGSRSGPYMTGANFTVADLLVHSVFLMFHQDFYKGFPTKVADKFANLGRVFELVEASPKVQEWNQMKH